MRPKTEDLTAVRQLLILLGKELGLKFVPESTEESINRPVHSEGKEL